MIDYTREELANGMRRWDLIVDTAGRRSLSHLRRALTPKGTLVIVGGDGGGSSDRRFLPRGPPCASVIHVRGANSRGLTSKEKLEDLQALSELIEGGKVSPVIDRTYPLIQAPDTIRYLEKGHPRGKVVIDV